MSAVQHVSLSEEREPWVRPGGTTFYFVVAFHDAVVADQFDVDIEQFADLDNRFFGFQSDARFAGCKPSSLSESLRPLRSKATALRMPGAYRVLHLARKALIFLPSDFPIVSKNRISSTSLQRS